MLPFLLRKGFTLVAALAVLVCAAGCNTSGYEKAWRGAALGPESARPIEGRWEGFWLSDVNAHTGRMRCIISHAHGKNYRFDFNSTFWKVFRHRTTLTFRVEQAADGTHVFSGSEELGPAAGGVYFYQGTFNGDDFHATYKSAYDHGTFQMRKVN